MTSCPLVNTGLLIFYPSLNMNNTVSTSLDNNWWPHCSICCSVCSGCWLCHCNSANSGPGLNRMLCELYKAAGIFTRENGTVANTPATFLLHATNRATRYMNIHDSKPAEHCSRGDSCCICMPRSWGPHWSLACCFVFTDPFMWKSSPWTADAPQRRHLEWLAFLPRTPAFFLPAEVLLAFAAE